ncbi:hypothetical protein [Verrucosispora sp. WMMC514]|uniref:hypothetical protein n=1 Tax=Verrucosispora sp. WMMC514 TaxID=3015156 RepID=UPI00248B0D6B|nr:hypothetical protein [Verrucosispora sp. WMMC514]WBB91546.1 hypothetical protein O7597_00375 [Verrucosispora sp. WMMC514]
MSVAKAWPARVAAMLEHHLGLRRQHYGIATTIVLAIGVLLLILAVNVYRLERPEASPQVPAGTPPESVASPAEPSAPLDDEPDDPPGLPDDVLDDLRWGGQGTTWFPHITAVRWRVVDGQQMLVASTDLEARREHRELAAKVCVQVGVYALTDDGRMWPIMVEGGLGEVLAIRRDISDPCKARF